jgi:hypothetical protein
MTRASHFRSLMFRRGWQEEGTGGAVMARPATKSIADDLDVARAARHIAPDGRLIAHERQPTGVRKNT